MSDPPKGIITDDQVIRAREIIAELLEDIDQNVILKIDRDFVRRANKYLDDTGSFAFNRRLTVAEWERLTAIHSQYVAYRKKKKGDTS